MQEEFENLEKQKLQLFVYVIPKQSFTINLSSDFIFVVKKGSREITYLRIYSLVHGKQDDANFNHVQ